MGGSLTKGPSVKFVLAIKDAILKKMGAICFPFFKSWWSEHQRTWVGRHLCKLNSCMSKVSPGQWAERNIAEILITNIGEKYWWNINDKFGEKYWRNVDDKYWWQLLVTNIYDKCKFNHSLKAYQFFVFARCENHSNTENRRRFFTSLGGYDSLNEMMSAPKWEVFSAVGNVDKIR